MTEQTLIALLAALGVLGAAALGLVGTGFGWLWRRITDLEARISKVTSENAKLRWWALGCRDMYFRYRKEGAPDLPDIPDPEEEQ